MTEPVTEQQPEVEPIAPVEAAPAVQDSDNSPDENDAVLDALLAKEFPNEPQRQAEAPSKPADADYERALKALQRDGVPADVIDSLRSSPDRVKEWGLRAAKRQADVDAFGAKVSEQNRKPEQKAAVGSAEPKPVAKEMDSIREFSEVFGEEAAKPLRDMQKRMDETLAERTRAMEVRYESQIAYQSLKSEYGKAVPTYEKIMETAAQLGQQNPASFSSVDEIMRAAASKLVGSPKRMDARDIARPTVGQSVNRVSAKADPDDAALDILLAGGSRDDVRRVINR